MGNPNMPTEDFIFSRAFLKQPVKEVSEGVNEELCQQNYETISLPYKLIRHKNKWWHTLKTNPAALTLPSVKQKGKLNG